MNIEDKKEGKNSNKKDIFGKAICILLALVLWGYVAYEKNPKTSKTFKNIKIELTESASLERKNMSALPTEMYVSVKLIGERNVLAKVNKNTLKANINLSDVTETGEQKNPNINITGIPSGLGIERIKITSGKLIVEKRETKMIDVGIDGIGKLDGSLRKVDEYAEPAQIEVSGPESLMKDVKITTEAINLSNVRKSEYEEQYKVVLKNSKGEGLNESLFRLSTHTVTVTRTYEKNKVIKLSAPDITGKLPGYNVTVESIEPSYIEISGRVEDVENLEEIDLGYIDAYGLAELPPVVSCSLGLGENIECAINSVSVKLSYEEIAEEIETLAETELAEEGETSEAA